jgi:predicted  nucleic acid-binding Zn-ribbon protein
MVRLAELQKIDDLLQSGTKTRGAITITSLEAKKNKLEKDIDSRTLHYYKRIRERHNDAVVPMKEGYCTGCGMLVPSLVSQEVRRKIGLNKCASCGRFLIIH